MKLSNVILVVVIVALFGFYTHGIRAELQQVFFDEVYVKAMNGDVENQVILAGLYMHGKFTGQDKAEAKKWYRRAAESGNKYAKYQSEQEF